MPRRFDKIKFVIVFVIFSAVMALVNRACLKDDDNLEKEEENVPAQEAIAVSDTLTYDSVFTLGSKNKIIGVRSFKEEFPDANDVQLEAAERNGIEPMDSRAQIDSCLQRGDLVYIGNSPYFKLDNLTHSIPYLTPKAYHLVNTICVNFLDSLQSKGLQPHIPIITSVLRTMDDIKNLQRGNINSIERSAHRYGTTVDIAYNRLMPVPTNCTTPVPVPATIQQKLVLSEVLRDLRLQGQCYVKYEIRQACFHLTVR